MPRGWRGALTAHPQGLGPLLRPLHSEWLSGWLSCFLLWERERGWGAARARGRQRPQERNQMHAKGRGTAWGAAAGMLIPPASPSGCLTFLALAPSLLHPLTRVWTACARSQAAGGGRSRRGACWGGSCCPLLLPSLESMSGPSISTGARARGSGGLGEECSARRSLAPAPLRSLAASPQAPPMPEATHSQGGGGMHPASPACPALGGGVRRGHRPPP